MSDEENSSCIKNTLLFQRVVIVLLIISAAVLTIQHTSRSSGAFTLQQQQQHSETQKQQKQGAIRIPSSSSSFQRGRRRSTTRRVMDSPARHRCPVPIHDKEREGLPAACPSEEELVTLFAMFRGGRHDGEKRDDGGRPWLLVDVGSNKGYSVLAMLRALKLVPDEISPQTLFAALVEYNRGGAAAAASAQQQAASSSSSSTSVAAFRAARRREQEAIQRANFCGSCNDCNAIEMPPEWRKAPKARRATVVGFDGFKSMVDFTNGFFCSHINHHHGGGVRFRFHHKVLSNESGEATFRQEGASMSGGELGLIGTAAWLKDGTKLRAEKSVKVRKTTLDEEFYYNDDARTNDGYDNDKKKDDDDDDDEVDGGTFIDVLLVDANGHDYFVADGARNLFRENRIGVYVVELWGNDRPLKEHIEWLDGFGYECFYPLNPSSSPAAASATATSRRYVPVTGRCFNNQNIVAWSNMICVSRRFKALVMELYHRSGFPR